MLHPHFITAALNDVYGIQSRSGCSCTGPLGHRLFGIKLDGDYKNEMSTAATERNVHSLKFGWARVNFNVSSLYLLLSFYVTSKGASLFASISSMKMSSPLSSEPSSSLPCTVGGCCLFIIATLRAGSSCIARLFLDRCE
jgi:hypothetical protein